MATARVPSNADMSYTAMAEMIEDGVSYSTMWIWILHALTKNPKYYREGAPDGVFEFVPKFDPIADHLFTRIRDTEMRGSWEFDEWVLLGPGRLAIARCPRGRAETPTLKLSATYDAQQRVCACDLVSRSGELTTEVRRSAEEQYLKFAAEGPPAATDDHRVGSAFEDYCRVEIVLLGYQGQQALADSSDAC